MTQPAVASGNRHKRPRALIFIESSAVRGAAKSVLTFLKGVRAQLLDDGGSMVFSVATFHRMSSADTQETDLIRAVRDVGFDLHVIKERRRWDPGILVQVRCLVNQVKPDLIHTNNVKSHAILKLLGLHRRSKWMASHHGYTTTDLKMTCYNLLDRWSLRSADQVVIPCRAFGRQLSGRGIAASRLTVVPNCGTVIPRPALHTVSATRSRLGLRSGDRVILSVGRLSAEKGHLDLIKAFRIVANKVPNFACKLLLVGSGPELSHLQTMASKLGIESRVSFLTNEPDVNPLLHTADIFALPSHSDGSPHVIFEAIGAEVPIVATSVGGVPEMLTDRETAVLVEAHRPSSIAEGLISLLANPDRGAQIARNASALLLSRYSPESYVAGMLRIYSDALDLAK